MDNITHSSPWAKLLPSLPRSVFTDSLDPFPIFPVHLLQLLRPFVVWANIRWDPLAWALWHPLFSQAGQLALLEDAFPATPHSWDHTPSMGSDGSFGASGVSQSSLTCRPRGDTAVNHQEQGPFRVILSCRSSSSPRESLPFADWLSQSCWVVTALLRRSSAWWSLS